MKNRSSQSLFLSIIIFVFMGIAQAAPQEASVVTLKKDVLEQSPVKKPAQTEEKKQKKVPLDPTKNSTSSRRKHQSKYKKKKVTMSYMSYEQMREAKDDRIKEKNREAAIKYAEKMLPLCKDMHEQRDLTLELADLLFDNAQLEKAGKIYQEFVKLYPGTAAIEHASYRAILCSFYSILDSQRDQTKTQETVDLTIAFLERSEIFTERNEEVLTIQKKCYERLVESEMNVLNYYLNNERFTAAQTRINGLRKDYALKIVDLEPRLLTCEIVIAEKQGNAQLVAEKRLALHDKYPTFSEVTTVIAQTTENNFVNKF